MNMMHETATLNCKGRFYIIFSSILTDIILIGLIGCRRCIIMICIIITSIIFIIIILASGCDNLHFNSNEVKEGSII